MPHKHPDFPYIDDFCDDEVFVFSTIGKGPSGEVGNPGPQGPKGDPGDTASITNEDIDAIIDNNDIPYSDDEFLNEIGLAHFWDRVKPGIALASPVKLVMHGIIHSLDGIGSFGQSAAYVGDRLFTMGQGHNNNDSVIAEVSTSTGLLVNTNVVPEIGHANGACEFNGNIFVANGTNVVVIDPDTLTVADVIETDLVGTSIANVFVVDGELCAVCHNNRIVSIDVDSGVTTILCNFTPISGAKQDACYHNGIVYQLYTMPNRVLEIDIKTGRTVAVKDIPRGDGVYPANEVEGIFVKDGVMCISTSLYRNGGINFSNAMSGLSIIFDTNLISDVIQTKQVEPDIIRNMMVNGNNSPMFKPDVTALNSVDIACAVVNYVGGGTISLYNYNETRESICLINCNCTIWAASGARQVHGFFVSNSNVHVMALTVKSYTEAFCSDLTLISVILEGNIKSLVSTLKVNNVVINLTTISDFFRNCIDGSVASFAKPTSFTCTSPQAQVFINLTTMCKADALRISCIVSNNSSVNTAVKHTLIHGDESIRYNVTGGFVNNLLAGQDAIISTSSPNYPKIKFSAADDTAYLSTADSPNSFTINVSGEKCLVRLDGVKSYAA